MSTTKKITIDIDRIAQLANMTPSATLKKKLETQLEKTLTHIESLENIPTNHITGTNEVNHLTNVTREDEIRPSLSQQDALKNSKKVYNGLFIVDAVLPSD